MEAAAFDTADGMYDCAWSEENEAIVIGACGDGSIKLYDLAAPPQANPLRSLQEHRREVSKGATMHIIRAVCHSPSYQHVGFRKGRHIWAGSFEGGSLSTIPACCSEQRGRFRTASLEGGSFFLKPSWCTGQGHVCIVPCKRGAFLPTTSMLQ